MKFSLIIDKEKEEEIIAIVHSATELVANIENMVLTYSGKDEIMVRGDYEYLSVKYSEIECITVIDRKVYVIDTAGSKYRITQNLSDVEKALPSYFIRINKSTIANERRIRGFKSSFSGAVDAIFKCGYKDYVSRRCFAIIKKRYNV